MRRLAFAHQLRAVAALSVAASHLVGVFWLIPGAVAAATRTPPVPFHPPAYLRLFENIWWEAGPFGVALFFLVSGLVIPLSLRDRSLPGFVAARIVRLFPTYLAALVLDVLVVEITSRLWHLPYGLAGSDFVANLLLVPNYTGSFSLDLVNWSLGVELRFYLLVAAVAALTGGIGPRAVLALSALLASGECVWRACGAPALPVLAPLLTEGVYVSFMLLGCVLQNHLTGRLSGARAALLLGACAALSAVCWREGPLAPQFPVVTASYAEALALFLVCYACRGLIPPMRPLDRLADISYPTYLVQSIVGYSALKLLMIEGGLAYSPALAVTVAIVLGTAFILHRAIEAPTMRISHRLGRRPAMKATPDAVRSAT